MRKKFLKKQHYHSLDTENMMVDDEVPAEYEDLIRALQRELRKSSDSIR